MNPSSNINNTENIAGMPNSNLLQGGVIKNFGEQNHNHHHHTCNNCSEIYNNGHQCSSLNDRIEKNLNIREKVFRNPNMPTLTLAEFADREMARMKEDEEKQKEYQLNKSGSDSEDDEVANKKTYKAREWDDWKDLNPKGSGNKMGK
jgi:hypothetical protein